MAGTTGYVNRCYDIVLSVDVQTVILALLTAILLPWCSWVSLVLIRIQIQLARGEENFDRFKEMLEDHEERIRTLESFHAISRLNNYT